MENKWFRRSWILVKVRWQFAGPTYCRSMGCCQIESCALSGNFVSCYAKFCLTIASWHLEYMFAFYWNIQVFKLKYSSELSFNIQSLTLDRGKLHLNNQLESFCFLNLLCPTGILYILLRIIQFLFFFFFFNKVYESFLNLSCHKQLKIAKGRGSEDSWAQQHHKDNKKKHWIITQKGCKTPIRSIPQHAFHCGHA